METGRADSKQEPVSLLQILRRGQPHIVQSSTIAPPGVQNAGGLPRTHVPSGVPSEQFAGRVEKHEPELALHSIFGSQPHSVQLSRNTPLSQYLGLFIEHAPYVVPSLHIETPGVKQKPCARLHSFPCGQPHSSQLSINAPVPVQYFGLLLEHV